MADLQTEVEELRTQLCEGSELRRARDDAYAKVQAMPTWQPVRGKGRGKGRAAYDKSYRVAVYSMLANGTPRCSIGRNIQAVVHTTAPWLEPKEPSDRFMTESRFELRTIEEWSASARGELQPPTASACSALTRARRTAMPASPPTCSWSPRRVRHVRWSSSVASILLCWWHGGCSLAGH